MPQETKWTWRSTTWENTPGRIVDMNADYFEQRLRKTFKARIGLLNRDIVPTARRPQDFATEHGLHPFVEDAVAINGAVAFKIETFEPRARAKMASAYSTTS